MFGATMIFADTICLSVSYSIYLYSVISFVGKVPLGTSMRDAEKLYSECADQVYIGNHY